MKNATSTTLSTLKTFATLNEALRWADHRNPPCYEEDETVLIEGKKVVFTFRDNGEYQFSGITTLTSADEELGVFFDAIFDAEENGAARKKAAKRAARERVVSRDLERRDARRAKSRLKRDESYC